MPAKSKQQQKFFGVVKAMKDGDIPKKGKAGDIADDMTKKEIDKYASTKHKGLPKKVKEQFSLFTFEDFVNEMEVTLNPGMNLPGMGDVVAPGVGDGSVGSGDRMDMGPKKKKKDEDDEEEDEDLKEGYNMKYKTPKVKGKKVATDTIEIDGVEPREGPDDGTVDAHASYAEFTNGKELNQNELDDLTDNNPDLIHRLSMEQYFESKVNEAENFQG